MVDNEGQVIVQSGRLRLSGGGSGPQTGSWAAPGSGSSLEFYSGMFALNRPSGRLVFSGATVTATALQSPGESIPISGGSVTLTDAAGSSQAQSLTLSGGTLSVAGSLAVADLTVSGISTYLQGAGMVSVSGSLAW